MPVAEQDDDGEGRRMTTRALEFELREPLEQATVLQIYKSSSHLEVRSQQDTLRTHGFMEPMYPHTGLQHNSLWTYASNMGCYLFT